MLKTATMSKKQKVESTDSLSFFIRSNAETTVAILEIKTVEFGVTNIEILEIELNQLANAIASYRADNQNFIDNPIVSAQRPVIKFLAACAKPEDWET